MFERWRAMWRAFRHPISRDDVMETIAAQSSSDRMVHYQRMSRSILRSLDREHEIVPFLAFLSDIDASNLTMFSDHPAFLIADFCDIREGHPDYERLMDYTSQLVGYDVEDA